jgi:hypothetical protein
LAPLEYIVATIIPKVERTTNRVDLLIWLFSYLPDRIASIIGKPRNDVFPALQLRLATSQFFRPTVFLPKSETVKGYKPNPSHPDGK